MSNKRTLRIQAIFGLGLVIFFCTLLSIVTLVDYFKIKDQIKDPTELEQVECVRFYFVGYRSNRHQVCVLVDSTKIHLSNKICQYGNCLDDDSTIIMNKRTKTGFYETEESYIVCLNEMLQSTFKMFLFYTFIVVVSITLIVYVLYPPLKKDFITVDE